MCTFRSTARAAQQALEVAEKELADAKIQLSNGLLQVATQVKTKCGRHVPCLTTLTFTSAFPHDANHSSGQWRQWPRK